MDGIIYAAAAAIGFSVVENVLYIASFGMSIAPPLRATISTLAHIAFSGLGGYYLGLAKFSTPAGPLIARALAVAAFFYMALSIFADHPPRFPPFVLVVAVLGLQALLFTAMGQASRISPPLGNPCTAKVPVLKWGPRGGVTQWQGILNGRTLNARKQKRMRKGGARCLQNWAARLRWR